MAAKVSAETSEAIFACLSDTQPKELTVDVRNREIRTKDGSHVWHFDLADRHQTMLLEGLDMLEATMKDLDLFEQFRQEHEKAFPWMSGLAGRFAKNL